MRTTTGSVTYAGEDGSTDERFLFEYSQEERQRNEINAANAELLHGFRYLTISRELIDAGLSGNDLILMAHFDSFQGAGKRYYFTNGQLSTLFHISQRAVADIIKRLKNHGFIEVNTKMRSGGGRIRFITLTKSSPQSAKIAVTKVQNLHSPDAKSALSVSAKSALSYNNKNKYLKDNNRESKKTIPPHSQKKDISKVDLQNILTHFLTGTSSETISRAKEYLGRAGVPPIHQTIELQSFASYWLEPDGNGVPRILDPKHTYFDIQRRLASWGQKAANGNAWRYKAEKDNDILSA